MDYVPKDIPEGINNPPENFLKQFFLFTLGTVVFVFVVFFVLSLFVDQLAKHMPESMDRSLRNKLRGVESPLFMGKKVEQSPFLTEILTKIDPELVKKMDLRIHVVCDSKVNAFATFGGEIYVLDGFLQQIDTENELVMVLGHELGHFSGRHHWRSLGNVAILILIKMSLSFAGIDTLTGTSSDIVFGKFSQSNESEADLYGIGLLNKYFNHVGGYNLFFDKLLTIPLDDNGAQHPGKIESWFSTHPYPADRNEVLKAYSVSQGMVEQVTSKLPAELKTICKKKT